MMFAASVQAANEEPTAVRVRHVDPALGSPREAKVLLNRLGDAAMEACGASSFSVAQYRQAVRDSACWRTSMTDVVQRIDNPYLTAAFEGRHVQQALATQGETAGTGR
ncbi:UrcA family protein [Sphingomonas sp. MMS24-J13]|uniref:UrcA family protein n=1 Tax=Sphingomonas sp. MMS24-J13 TaxID=3238686 RepID=UPI00384D3A3B